MTQSDFYITTKKGKQILVTTEIQIGENGRPFRISKVEKDFTTPFKWVNGVKKGGSILTFIYTDKNEFFEVKINHLNEVI